MDITNLIFIHFLTYYARFIIFSCHIDNIEAGNLEVESLNFNGTWDDFCDESKMDADFANWTDHDLKRLRIMLCQLKATDQINRNSIPAFTAYKYCNNIRSTTEGFYKELKKKFIEHPIQITAEMATSVRPTDECYTKSMGTFHRECMGKHNPCFRMFQSLISSTCVIPGITSQDISRYMVEVCAGKYVSDQINWEPIYMSLRYYD